jgi:hypothetical protein
MDQKNNISSESRWHELARTIIAERILDRGLGPTDAALRRQLMAERPTLFSTGYPAKVWEHEVKRATNGLREERPRPPLAGEWPLTERQKAFFAE